MKTERYFMIFSVLVLFSFFLGKLDTVFVFRCWFWISRSVENDLLSFSFSFFFFILEVGIIFGGVCLKVCWIHNFFPQSVFGSSFFNNHGHERPPESLGGLEAVASVILRLSAAYWSTIESINEPITVLKKREEDSYPLAKCGWEGFIPWWVQISRRPGWRKKVTEGIIYRDPSQGQGWVGVEGGLGMWFRWVVHPTLTFQLFDSCL